MGQVPHNPSVACVCVSDGLEAFELNVTNIPIHTHTYPSSTRLSTSGEERVGVDQGGARAAFAAPDLVLLRGRGASTLGPARWWRQDLAMAWFARQCPRPGQIEEPFRIRPRRTKCPRRTEESGIGRGKGWGGRG